MDKSEIIKDLILVAFGAWIGIQTQSGLMLPNLIGIAIGFFLVYLLVLEIVGQPSITILNNKLNFENKQKLEQGWKIIQKNMIPILKELALNIKPAFWPPKNRIAIIDKSNNLQMLEISMKRDKLERLNNKFLDLGMDYKSSKEVEHSYLQTVSRIGSNKGELGTTISTTVSLWFYGITKLSLRAGGQISKDIFDVLNNKLETCNLLKKVTVDSSNTQIRYDIEKVAKYGTVSTSIKGSEISLEIEYKERGGIEVVKVSASDSFYPKILDDLDTDIKQALDETKRYLKEKQITCKKTSVRCGAAKRKFEERGCIVIYLNPT